jgi:putative PIN family toxin of toxin-antitoxin system
MSAIGRKSEFRPIFDAMLNQKYTLIISNDVISEYEEILIQKANSLVANNILESISNLPNVEKQDIFYKWKLIDIDKDDNKFVDCAVAGSADYIVTNDKHFNTLKNIGFPPVNIISLSDFMLIIDRL